MEILDKHQSFMDENDGKQEIVDKMTNKRSLECNDGIGKKSKKDEKEDDVLIPKKLIKKEQDKKNEIQESTDMFRKKLRDAIKILGIEKVKNNLNSNSKLSMNKDGEAIILMKCANPSCEDPWKERVPNYFFKSNKGKNWLLSKPGYETLHNSISTSCKQCRILQQSFKIANYHLTQENHVFCRYSKLTRDWFEKESNKHNGRYYISNQLINLNKDDFYRASPNRKNNTIEKKPSEHSPENCEIIELVFNISQYDVIEDISKAISHIFELAIHGFEHGIDTSNLVEDAKRNFASLSCRENGVDAHLIKDRSNYDKQRRDRDLKYILVRMIYHSINRDKTKRRSELIDEDYPTIKNNIFQLLIDQKFICAYSGVSMKIENGSQRFSLERKDNAKPHFGPNGELDNVVWICRIFNGPCLQMSRYRFLEILLSQIRKPMSEDVRKKVELEFSKCEKPIKEVLMSKKIN